MLNDKNKISCSRFFLFVDREHKFWWFLCLIFLILFRRFWKIFFILFRRFSKQNRRKNVRSCEFLLLPAGATHRKNSQERTFFSSILFWKTSKKNKKIFQKRRKRTRKISTRTIKIYVLDQQTKKKITRIKSCCYLFFFVIENILMVLVLFFFSWQVFCSFSTFSKQNWEKNVRSCEFF